MAEHAKRALYTGTILVTGADGQVGWEVQRTLAPLGRVLALRRADVDVTNGAALRDVVRSTKPSIIVNAAAYTAVDQAEGDRALAFAVNADAPRILAEEAARLGSLLVHYSTDYVFDGASRSPYLESCAAAPVNVYGESKLAGERAIADIAASHLILRTSWIYGARGRNFLRTMLRLAHEREELRVVNDQIGVPTPARLVAQVTALAVSVLRPHGDVRAPSGATGVFHVSARGETSWFDFATRVLARDPNRAAQRCHGITPVSTAEFATPARRPAYSVLNPSKLEQQFHLRMPEWTSLLDLVMDDVRAE